MSLSDAQWARIEPLLPDRTPKRGGRWRDHRQVIDAIAFKYRTGLPWTDLPEHFGSWKGVRRTPGAVRWSASRRHRLPGRSAMARTAGRPQSAHKIPDGAGPIAASISWRWRPAASARGPAISPVPKPGSRKRSRARGFPGPYQTRGCCRPLTASPPRTPGPRICLSLPGAEGRRNRHRPPAPARSRRTAQQDSSA
ncbi:transposase [Streptomyces sp. McG3]|nr:transposase [Streptomyces sp. McG3]